MENKMTRGALVIKTYGDPEIAGAIVDGLTRRMIPLNSEEYRAVKAEYARVKHCRKRPAYGDDRRLRAARERMAKKYAVKPVGRVSGAVLVVWALLWLGIYTICDWVRYGKC